ncbi:universal stress protein [Inhella proteolytica]|uniref:Universal stress protein n=1 Tax=Inhella proteolytica TaxID=2795029 RepID=A0A931J2X6_9BURK|nr:universal stress protein [Inhella proteolytica]MBH9578556.1 universal stress protein [Inhella proteolytica]
MDSIRQIVVHFGDASPASQHALGVAAALARQHGAGLSLRAVVESVASGAYLSPEAAALATQLVTEQMQTLKTQAQAQLEAQCGGVQAELVHRADEAVDHLIEASRATDLLVLSQPEPGRGLSLEAMARILVQASCPVLLVPFIGAAPTLGQTVLLAWSGTRESARAMNDALPWLRAARQVEQLALDAEEPLAWSAVQAHLRRHGVPLQPRLLPLARQPSLGERLARAWSPDASVAEALLSRAADSGADLIVCGAYGHPRAWELVLGGVTRELLQSMTVPVLFSH